MKSELQYLINHKEEISEMIPREHLRKTFIRSEIFALTLKVEKKELDEIAETAWEMEKRGLFQLPYPSFIVFVSEEKNPNEYAAIFYDKEDCFLLNKDWFDPHLPLDEREGGIAMMRTVLEKLVVLLGTRGAVVKRDPVSKMRKMGIGKQKNYGDSSVTYIAAPEEGYEIDEATGEAVFTGRKVRPHFRRGYLRRKHITDIEPTIWVQPCFVNGATESDRKAYVL